MISRRGLLIAGLALASTRSLAQQGKMPRVGILSARSRSTPSNPDPTFDAFADGMRKLGYIDGRNVAMEWRFAEDKLERLPELAAELVQLKVDVIVTHATPAVRAAMQATKTIPVVMTSTSDPVGSGFTSSMARPDRNVTGLTIVAADLAPKHLDFLKILVPNMTKVAVLVNPGNTSHAAALKGVQAAAQSRGIQTLVLDAAGADELRRAFDAMHRAGVKAAIMPADSSFVAHRRLIAELGIKRKIVVMQYSRENVVSGGLISYGTNVADSYRRAATYVDKILKGAKPADLPIEQPSSYHLVFNLKSAKAMGLRVPQEILGRADEIIE